MKHLIPTPPILQRFCARAFTWLGIALLACATIWTVRVHAAGADNRKNGANVMPPNSRPYGLTYAEWHARWWQWSISIPWATHPYQSAEFAAVNQDGPVWFLVGYTPDLFGNIIPRDITVPRGKAVFFPILNVECSNVEGPPFFGADEAAMRDCVREFVLTDMVCEIDGRPVRNLEKFAGESPLFDFDAPDGNILTLGPAVSGQGVDTGTYVMVPPLSVGQHTIRFSGGIPIGFGGIYNITVR